MLWQCHCLPSVSNDSVTAVNYERRIVALMSNKGKKQHRQNLKCRNQKKIIGGLEIFRVKLEIPVSPFYENSTFWIKFIVLLSCQKDVEWRVYFVNFLNGKNVSTSIEILLSLFHKRTFLILHFSFVFTSHRLAKEFYIVKSSKMT